MKLKECPRCEEERWLGDKLVPGRKLQQYCGYCGWEGEPRIPETKPIKVMREVRVGQFYGWHYEIYR